MRFPANSAAMICCSALTWLPCEKGATARDSREQLVELCRGAEKKKRQEKNRKEKKRKGKKIKESKKERNRNEQTRIEEKERKGKETRGGARGGKNTWTALVPRDVPDQAK